MGAAIARRRRAGLPGQGDHLVSEALYLFDRDGDGIKIYRDRPRAEGHWDDAQQVRMATH
jgi:catechol 2,3-dioxygenase